MRVLRRTYGKKSYSAKGAPKYGGVGGLLPRKIFKFRVSEMSFFVFPQSVFSK